MAEQLAKLQEPDTAVVIAADLNSQPASNSLKLLLENSKPVKERC